MSEGAIDETPWEITVFAALLKMRWAYYGDGERHVPDAVNALDHAAETELGDVLLRERDRIFLFELKASWTRAATEVDKPIFARYLTLHKDAQQQSGSTEFTELMQWSTRCHHLVYWEDVEELDDGSVRGEIAFSPYALFVLDRVGSASKLATDYRHWHALSLSKNGVPEIVEAASVAALFAGSAQAASGNLSTGEGVEFLELGLNKEEFIKFVERLRGKKGTEDIKVKIIAFSPESGFIRVVRSLNDAVQLGNDWIDGKAYSNLTRTASSVPGEPICRRRAGVVRSVNDKPLTGVSKISHPTGQRSSVKGMKKRH